MCLRLQAHLCTISPLLLTACAQSLSITHCAPVYLQGSALDMLEDVNTGIAWVLRKVQRYGGNPDQVWLVGQSAGGQLAMLALLSQAAQVRLASWRLLTHHCPGL